MQWLFWVLKALLGTVSFIVGIWQLTGYCYHCEARSYTRPFNSFVGRFLAPSIASALAIVAFQILPNWGWILFGVCCVCATILCEAPYLLETRIRKIRNRRNLVKRIKTGDESAIISLSVHYINDGLPKRGVALLVKAAETGNVEAMCRLGWYYGIKKKAPDHEKAVEWWRRAANGGSALSMRRLGEYYQRKDDLVEATKWYEEAVNSGDVWSRKLLREFASAESRSAA